MTPPTEQRRAILAACADMIRACGLTLAELAEHLGQTLQGPVVAPAGNFHGAAHHSLQRGILPCAGPSLRQSEILRLIDCEAGASHADLQRSLVVASNTISGYVAALAAQGLVTRVKVPGLRTIRYFAQPAHAAAWYEANAAISAAAVAQRSAAVNAAKEARRKQSRALMRVEAAAARAAAREVQAAARAQRAADLDQKTKSTAQPTSRRIGQERAAAGPAFTAGDSKVIKVAANAEVTYAPGFKGIQRAVTPAPRYSVQPGDALPGGFSSCPPGMNPATGKAWEAMA